MSEISVQDRLARSLPFGLVGAASTALHSSLTYGIDHSLVLGLITLPIATAVVEVLYMTGAANYPAPWRGEDEG